MMGDPLCIVVSVVNGILGLVKEAKTNQEGCQLLASLAERTLSTLKQLENRELTDPLMATALELVNDALSDAHKAVEECCKSNFFIAIVHRENYATSLRHAAEKLEHALSQVSIASVGMTADIQSELAALSDHIRQAKFTERAEIAHQSKALKDELEKAFFRTGQGNEEVKSLIREMIHEHNSSTEEMKKELVTLKAYATDAHAAKEKQHEFEVNQIIAVLSESLGEGSGGRKITEDWKDHLCCPISQEIMREPVVLRESGMIYDRSSIMEWLRRGHHHDPLTNIELVSGDFFPCWALQAACKRLLEESEASSLVVDNPPIEESKPQMIVPGLYEGQGRLMIGSKIIHTSQVLVLEPSGLASGCSLYERENSLSRRNELEFGSGEWENASLQLSFEDDRYMYNGEVNLRISARHLGMEWTGKVSVVNAPHEKHDFRFVFSTPYVSQSIWARPGILQMESDIVSTRNNVKYKSKLVLVLEDDFMIDGRMWFESVSIECKSIGHISEGSWDSDGSLTFKIEFALADKTHRLKIIRRDHFASYKVTGSLTSHGKGKLPAFIAVVVKVTGSGASPKDNSSYIPLDDQDRLEYSYVREATTPWYRFAPGPLHMFQISDDCELESGEYCIRADLDIGGCYVPYHMHVARDPCDFVTLPAVHVSWHSSHVFDQPYWVRAEIWKIEKTMPSGGYKLTLSENPWNAKTYNHVGKIMDVWQHEDPNRKRGECYLCVSEASRNEDHCAWTLKRRYDKSFHLVLEIDRNPKIVGGDYYLSHPDPKNDIRNGWSQYASLTQNPGKALRIILEPPHQK